MSQNKDSGTNKREETKRETGKKENASFASWKNALLAENRYRDTYARATNVADAGKKRTMEQTRRRQGGAKEAGRRDDVSV